MGGSVDDDEFNEATPVHMPPTIEGMDRRLRQTLSIAKESRDAAKVCVDDTKATRSELAAHRKHDEDALAAIHAELAEQKDSTSKAALRLDDMQTQLTAIASSAAKSEGALGILVEDVNARRQIETQRALAVIETEKQKQLASTEAEKHQQLALTEVDKTAKLATIDDKADKAKTWRTIVKRLIIGGITVGGSVVGYLLGGGCNG